MELILCPLNTAGYAVGTGEKWMGLPTARFWLLAFGF